MKVKDFYIKNVHRKDVKDFIEKNHYSGSINGVMWSYCFQLLYDTQLLCCMLYGKMAMAWQWEKVSR